jgi:hypothetical protein
MNKKLIPAPNNLKSKTCPFDKLRAGSELCRRIENLKWLGLSAIAFVLVAAVVVASAQQPKKVFRIGYLSSADPAFESTRSEAIRLALRERGYIEGQNIAFEYRYAEGKLIGSLSLRPSWCVSRSISSWQQEGP